MGGAWTGQNPETQDEGGNKSKEVSLSHRNWTLGGVLMQGFQHRKPGWKWGPGRGIHCRNETGPLSPSWMFSLRKSGCWLSFRNIEQQDLLGSLGKGSPDVQAWVCRWGLRVERISVAVGGLRHQQTRALDHGFVLASPHREPRYPYPALQPRAGQH